MSQNIPAYVDFKAVKHAVTMLDILRYYGLMDRLTPKGKDKLVGPCPIHKGSQKTGFQVSRSKNAWYCFGRCKTGGGILDFVAGMENTDILGAAILISEWFDLEAGADEEGERPSGNVSHEDPDDGASQTPPGRPGYIRELEDELRGILDAGDTEAAVRFFKEKCIESYRNGKQTQREQTLKVFRKRLARLERDVSDLGKVLAEK